MTFATQRPRLLDEDDASRWAVARAHIVAAPVPVLRSWCCELEAPFEPSTNGAASGPAVLATAHDDGVERAIELAHDHVDVACEHLEATGIADTSEIHLFAVAMLRQLVLRSQAETWVGSTSLGHVRRG